MHIYHKTAKKKDVFWALNPLLQICRIFGLAPYPLAISSGKPSLGRTSLFYSIAILCVSSAITITALAFDLGISFRIQTESTVSQLAGALWNSINDLIGAVSVAVYLYKRRKCYQLFQDISEYDERLKISAPPKYENTRKSVNKQLVCFMGILLAFGYSASCRSRLFGVFERLISYYWLTMSMIQNLKFYNIILILQWRMSCFNERVRKCLPFCYLHSYNICYEMVEKLVKDLESLRLCIYRLCRNANNVYGMQILLLALMNVMNVTFVSYFAFIYRDFNLWNVPRLLYYTIIWVVIFLIGMVLVIVACEGLAKEAEKTGVLVTEALLKVQDENVRRELRLFSHQLFHTKIRFTACGFFSLDYGLLKSMSAAVVTHLVILVQFQLAGKESTCFCSYEMETNSSNPFS